ncbi:MAG: Hsp20/alpha crystallin family protein [Bacteroidales bacterium]|nr:Hsp20/alpha crystallin family protein [Bacteroidales bacterium]MCF8327122.1 Hsp20/alpha crystallin family protein [Bacteroidales bacterium]
MVLINPNYRHGFPTREGPYFHRDEESNQCQCLPAANLLKYDDRAEIHLFAPGRTKEDFSIRLDNDVLTISSDAKSEDQGEYIQQEFVAGEFSRNFQISDLVDNDKIEASYESGILKIKLPFKEESQPKKQDIKVS